MVDIRLPASGAIRVRWALPNAFANWKSPTVTEANAALDIAESVSWNDFDFGVQASSTNDDPAITNKGNVQDLGASQFGGGLSFYYPHDHDDASNIYSVTYDALDEPCTAGYLLISIDGDLSENDTPLYSGGATRSFAAGDFVHVFKVMTDGYAESITGEEAFRYTITFLPQGDLAVYTIIRAATPPAVTVLPATNSGAVGTVGKLEGTVAGRRYTRGLHWTTSNAAIVSISQNGVYTRKAAGTATITGTFEATGTSATATVTVV